MSALDHALTFVFAEEGGFSDRAADPGGRTNFGVREVTYDAWRTRHGLGHRDVKDIAKDEACMIYREEYWTPIKGDRLSEISLGLAVAAMDWAVNSGPAMAVKRLQELAGVHDDGVLGPESLAAVAECVAIDRAGFVERYAKMRAAFLADWAAHNPGNPGVLRRVPNLLHYIATLPDTVST